MTIRSVLVFLFRCATAVGIAIMAIDTAAIMFGAALPSRWGTFMALGLGIWIEAGFNYVDKRLSVPALTVGER